MNRSAQVIRTGQYIVPAIQDGHMPPADDESTLSWLDALCVTFGLLSGTLRVVDWADDDPDPRTGELLQDPNQPVDDESAPAPDPNGFLLAVFVAIGKDAGRSLSAKYMDFTVSLTASGPNYAVARAAVEDAHTAGDLDDTQYAAITSLYDTYHIPES